MSESGDEARGMDAPGVMKSLSVSSPLRFRAAGAEDVPAVVELVESAYRGDASRAGWTTEADFLDGRRTGPDEIQAILSGKQSQLLLAEDDHGMLGCAHVAVEEGAGYLGMFSVDPRRQGRGVGSLLLAEAERIVREQWGCAAMRMTVIDIRDDLIPYYERRGYRRTGIKKPFPYGDARFGLPKRDDLRFEVLEKPLVLLTDE